MNFQKKHIVGFLLVLVSLFGFVVSTTAKSGDGTVTSLGNKNVQLVPPAGFVEVSHTFSDFFKEISQAAVPPSNELLALYVSQKDFKSLEENKPLEMKQYMMVQTLRNLKDKTFLKNIFIVSGISILNIINVHYGGILTFNIVFIP